MDMTPDPDHGPYIRFNVGPDSFGYIQQNARQFYDREVVDLTCSEIVLILGGLLAKVDSESGLEGEVFAPDGRSVVNDRLDGRAAFGSFVLKEVSDIPVGLEVILNVTHPQTRWDKMLNRRRISNTYHYSNY